MKTRTNNAVWNEKRKHWKIQVQSDGVRKSFYSSTPGTAGKRECNAKADAFLRSGVAPTVRRVRAVADEWLETLKPTREFQSSSNYKQYEYMMRKRILPIIGLKKVQEVSNGDIQRVIDAAAKDNLSKKTLQGIRGCIVAFFKYCRKNRYADLIVSDIDIPRDAKRSEKEILQPDALRKVLTIDTRLNRGQPEYDYYVNMYRWQLVTGMRPGEMIARTKADVKDGFVYIKSSRNIYGELTNGKNDNAVRRIKITQLAQNILKDQEAAERRLGITSTLLFPETDGGYCSEATIYKHWTKYQKDNGIDHISLYELRHTFVSICAEAVPENLLKLVVGHSESMDTTGVYGHMLQGQLDRAADAIASSFDSAMK